MNCWHASWLDQDQLAFRRTDVQVNVAPVAILPQIWLQCRASQLFVLFPGHPWFVLQGMRTDIIQLWRSKVACPSSMGLRQLIRSPFINANIELDTIHRDHVPRRRQRESFLCWAGRLGRCAKRNSSRHRQIALQQQGLVHVLCTTSTPSSLLRSAPWSDSWMRSKPSGALCRSSDKLFVL